MLIYRLLQHGDFGPEATWAMVVAFEDAMQELNLADHTHPIAEIVALKIIEIGKRGVCNSHRIRELALKDIHDRLKPVGEYLEQRLRRHPALMPGTG